MVSKKKIIPVSKLKVKPLYRRGKKIISKTEVQQASKVKLRKRTTRKTILGPLLKKLYKDDINTEFIDRTYTKSMIRLKKLKKKVTDKEKYKSLKRWRNLLKGQPIFILGNSPSIVKHRLSLLDPYFTIGLNRIFYIYSSTILFWQDKLLWDSERKNILKCKSIRVSRDLSDPMELFLNFKLGYDPFRFSSRTDKFYGRGNTGVIAAEFAIALGCSCLIFLGTDCKYSSSGQTDFYGINQDHSKETLTRCKKAMRWLKENCPVPIYNCSENDLWSKKTLPEILMELKPQALGRKYFINLFLKKEKRK